MNMAETADFIRGCMCWWQNLGAGQDLSLMCKAWSYALADVPKSAAVQGARDLARRLKYPPTPADVIEASAPYMHHNDLFSRLWLDDCAELGLLAAPAGRHELIDTKGAAT